MGAFLHPDLAVDLQARASTTPLPPAGWAWAEPEEAWWRVVGQICAVGSARSWDALGPAEVRKALAPRRVQALGPAAPREVHRTLAAIGVRYCSPKRDASTKARAIARNAGTPWVLDEEGDVVLLDRLREEVGPPDERGCWSLEQARQARRVLVRELVFVGSKSASDLLLGLGLTEDMVALDIRILNLLVDGLGWAPASRQVGTLRAYERVEREVMNRLGHPNGLNGVTLDRTLFHHYRELMPLWKRRARPDAASPKQRPTPGSATLENSA